MLIARTWSSKFHTKSNSSIRNTCDIFCHQNDELWGANVLYAFHATYVTRWTTTVRPPPGDRKWFSSANGFNSKNSKFTSKVISLLWRDDTLLFIHSFICRVIYVMAKWVLAWFFFWLNQYIRHCVFMLMSLSLVFCFVFVSFILYTMNVSSVACLLYSAILSLFECL